MKYLIFTIFLISSSINAQELAQGIPPASQIVVNNRVFVKINGKAITLMDVVKKMDMILLREHQKNRFHYRNGISFT